MKLQKLGGYAAIVSICAYLAAVGVILFKAGFALTDPAKLVTALLAAPAYSYAFFLLFTVSYLLLFIVAFALQERMEGNAPHLTRLMLIAASAFTVMLFMYVMISWEGSKIITPTHDVSAYRALIAITVGFLKTAGILAACACLFTGGAILKTRSLSRALGWLYLLTGVLWMLHFMISLIAIHFVFLAAANIWVGIALLRQEQPQPAAR